MTVKAEDFYELLKKRRSIRQYKTIEVPQELIERVVQAGLYAPSGKNRQNWRFFIVQGEKRNQYLAHSQKSWLPLRDVLKQRLKPSLYEFTERFFYTLGGAPVIIFCYSQNTADEKHLTSVGSVYMAVENIVLAAQLEGLGTCTMGAPLEIQKEVDEFLGVTSRDDYKRGELQLLCAITLGYPNHEPPSAPRQLEDRIHWVK